MSFFFFPPNPFLKPKKCAYQIGRITQTYNALIARHASPVRISSSGDQSVHTVLNFMKFSVFDSKD